MTRPVPEDSKGKCIVDIVIWGAYNLKAKDIMTKSSDPYDEIDMDGMKEWDE